MILGLTLQWTCVIINPCHYESERRKQREYWALWIMPAKIRICTNRPVYSDRRDGYTDCKPSAIGMRKCRFLRYLVWMFRLSAMAAVYNLNNPHCNFFHKGNNAGTMLCSHRRTNKLALWTNRHQWWVTATSISVFDFQSSGKRLSVFSLAGKIRELLIFAWLLFGRCFRTSRYSSGYSNLHLSTGILGFQYPTAIFTMAKRTSHPSSRHFSEEQLPDSNQIHLIPNQNTGGSGGFTRGIQEALHREQYTHVLLMDDDIIADWNGVQRAISFLSICKPEQREAFLKNIPDHSRKQHCQRQQWWTSCSLRCSLKLEHVAKIAA